jgi:hypothetical protein
MALVTDPPPTAHIFAHDALICIIDLKGTLYTDQTSHVPFVSSISSCYIMILHHVDSNSSWSKALKNNSKGKLTLVRHHALAQMAQCSIVSRHQILDNQATFAYKTKIELTKMTYELVPPNNHCCNLAKKAIQTFKDHMVSVLSRCSPTMTMHLWCQLLPQIKRQLLLLCQSKANPNILAYAHMYGHHDYNCTHLSPSACRPLSMTNPTSAAHSLSTAEKRSSWVLGTSTEHYWCNKLWSVTMQATRISGVAFFKHKYLTNPTVTPEDRVIAAAGVLT